jgi:hypothetical protein
MNEPLYEIDYYAWTQRQVELIKKRRWEELDLDNLLEELEEMGKSSKSALESRLEILFMHLLKWQFQSENRSNSWKASILELKLADIVYDVYEDARISASKETNLPLNAFPEVMPFTYEQAMNPHFWPQ